MKDKPVHLAIEIKHPEGTFWIFMCGTKFKVKLDFVFDASKVTCIKCLRCLEGKRSNER